MKPRLLSIPDGASNILFRVGHEGRRRPGGYEVSDRKDDACGLAHLFGGEYGRRDVDRIIQLKHKDYLILLRIMVIIGETINIMPFNISLLIVLLLLLLLFTMLDKIIYKN